MSLRVQRKWNTLLIYNMRSFPNLISYLKCLKENIVLREVYFDSKVWHSMNFFSPTKWAEQCQELCMGTRFFMVIYGNKKIKIDHFQEACFRRYFHLYYSMEVVIMYRRFHKSFHISRIHKKLTNCRIGVRISP